VAVVLATESWIQKGVYRVFWDGLAAGDSGSGVAVAALADKTVQVLGTFGGTTITIEGSNDGGTTWNTLNDTRGEGNGLSITSADTRQVLENPRLIRPLSTGGAGANVDVILICR